MRETAEYKEVKIGNCPQKGKLNLSTTKVEQNRETPK